MRKKSDLLSVLIDPSDSFWNSIPSNELQPDEALDLKLELEAQSERIGIHADKVRRQKKEGLQLRV